jgi:N-acyl-D-amino-acid deacylase
MRPVILALPLVVLASSARADAPSEAVKGAIEKGLVRVQKGAASYLTHRQCFSCHHQLMSILSLTSARQHGFAVEPERLPEQVEATLEYFRPRLKAIAKGGDMGGGNETASQALLALDAAGHPADEVTTALVQFLFQRQAADGSWPVFRFSSRPPSGSTPYRSTAIAMRGLRVYGQSGKYEELREEAPRDTALAHGKEWLLKSKPETTEDKVWRLRGLIYAEADKDEVAAARDLLLKEQKADGSWSQLPEMAGDAYATGTVLMALRHAGLETNHAAYQKGVQSLLATQKEDGSWFVQTRAKPVQTFFDNGDPGGKSQFISFAATNWAVLALLETLPVKPAPGEAAKAGR